VARSGRRIFGSGCGEFRKNARIAGWHPRCPASGVVEGTPPFSVDSVVVGRSPRMRTVFDFVEVIAGSESNVLIVGETGTGKETLANLIHHASRRRRQPFVAVSCAILTETLIES
jgi:transcriptional regulator of acetoin/glycerol metabolism